MFIVVVCMGFLILKLILKFMMMFLVGNFVIGFSFSSSSSGENFYVVVIDRNNLFDMFVVVMCFGCVYVIVFVYFLLNNLNLIFKFVLKYFFFCVSVSRSRSRFYRFRGVRFVFA